MKHKNPNSQKDLLNIQALLSEISDVDIGYWSNEYENTTSNKCLLEARNILDGGLHRNESPSRQIFDIILNSGTTTNSYNKPELLSLNEDFKFYTEEEIHLSKDLLTELSSQIKKLPKDTLLCSEGMYHLLHSFTSNLPVPYKRYEGVSLFDYSKILAAISVCLYESDNKDKPFLLLRADVSGIQNYIFNISSKHAAKNLKGRSLYVRLLSDTILYRVLGEFGLYQSNIVYSSGGNFMLLAPNTQQIRDALNENNQESLVNKINQHLFSQYQTDISVVLDYVPLTKEELEGRSLKKQIGELFKKIDKKKKQKFASAISFDFDKFFNPTKVRDAGGSTKRDAITGEEFEINETAWREEKGKFIKYDFSDESEEFDLFKTETKKQIELGKILKDVKYWIISYDRIDVKDKKYEFAPANLGVYHYFVVSDKTDIIKEYVIKGAIILELNEPEFFTKDAVFGKNNTYGFTFYGGNGFPTFEYNYKDSDDPDLKKLKQPYKFYKKDDAKTFNHLAFRLRESKNDKEEGEKAGRFSRLGVLRMDVDGLGWLFSEGLRNEIYNLPTYAAISRSLDVFFVGILNNLWENSTWKSPANSEEERLKDYTQIIYSGGDDLFIVGRWDACIEFAKIINSKFKKWTCQHTLPDNAPLKLSISGGVAIVTHKFPIIKGAEFAGDLEKMAKKYEVSLNGDIYEKNAFTLWKPIHWQYEFPVVEKLKNRVLYFYAKKEYCSVFQRIMSFYALKQQSEDTDEDRKGSGSKFRWIWLLVYNISRTIEQYRANIVFCDFLTEIQNGIFENGLQKKKLIISKNDYFDLLHLAIRWADLEYRTFHQ